MAQAPVTPAASWLLTPEQVAESERQATAGDAEAALKLSMHYGFGKRDAMAERRWLKAASDLGSADGQYGYGLTLLRSTDEASKQEGIALLEKAAAAGHLLARRELERRGMEPDTAAR
jgi:TPR repeat protein